MSYSAYVVCDCFREGKTTPPPHQKYLRFDEDGLYIDIPDELWSESEAAQMESEFNNWKDTACEHDEMDFAFESLCNNYGMVAFRHIIRTYGGQEKFPILSDYLPSANGGVLPSNFAEQALDELLLLEQETSYEEKIILNEKESKDVLASINADTHHFLVYSAYNKYAYGIDGEGFFILENKNNKNITSVIFRSNHFIQKHIRSNHYQFIDIASGKYFECNTKLYPNEEKNISKHQYEFSVQREKVDIASEYSYIIEPLKRLLKASIITNNPIHWI